MSKCAVAKQPEVLVQPVTLCGRRDFSGNWLSLCVNSWERLSNVLPITVLNDGTLGDSHIEKLRSLGLTVLDGEECEQRIDLRLKPFPHVREMRSRLLLFRKLIDPALLLPASQRILFLDTDVYFTRRCELPDPSPRFIYLVDDICGYAAHWSLPLVLPILLGLNSGFMMYDPAVVDLEFLDELCRRFLLVLPPTQHWWAEQAAWASLGARHEDVCGFHPDECRVVDGMRKSSSPLRQNGLKLLFPSRSSDAAVSGFASLAVVHLAGSGKRLIDDFVTTNDGLHDVQRLRSVKVTPATGVDSAILSLRMLLRQIYKRVRTPNCVRPGAPHLREHAVE